MRSAMRWMVMDDLMVCVTSAGEPDKATVTRFLDELRTKPIRRLLSMPLSISDELSGERLACSEICQSHGIKVALVVEASLAAPCAIFTAMSAPSTIAAFSSDDMDVALAHVDVRGAAVAPVRAAFAAMVGDPAALAA